MPELPEVETVRTALEHHLVGRSILGVQTSGQRLREPLPEGLPETLAGDRFVRARRRAKFLLLDLQSRHTLLVHLGMSGNLLLRPGGGKHDHLILELDSGPPLVFNDPRRFGLVLLYRTRAVENSPYLVKLGVEPLEKSFDALYLRSVCKGRSRPIKNLIMDASIVAGVGNIYASEALFRAGILPTSEAQRIGPRRLARLAREIKNVLRTAIRRGGTTIADYRGSGEGGRFQQELCVYGRNGKECLVCERPLRTVVLAGRNTCYCARCQR